MPARNLSGEVVALVASLPPAADYEGAMLRQGSGLWYSNGTLWTNLLAGGGGGGGITWSTVAVNTTMAADNAYIVTGVRNMTLPATTVAGEVYIVHAYSGIVTVVSNGNVITGVGASNNLTIAIGETAQLVVRSAGNLEIV